VKSFTRQGVHNRVLQGFFEYLKTRFGGCSGLSSNAYSLRRYAALAAALQARARALSTAGARLVARAAATGAGGGGC